MSANEDEGRKGALVGDNSLLKVGMAGNWSGEKFRLYRGTLSSGFFSNEGIEFPSICGRNVLLGKLLKYASRCVMNLFISSRRYAYLFFIKGFLVSTVQVI